MRQALAEQTSLETICSLPPPKITELDELVGHLRRPHDPQLTQVPTQLSKKVSWEGWNSDVVVSTACDRFCITSGCRPIWDDKDSTVILEECCAVFYLGESSFCHLINSQWIKEIDMKLNSVIELKNEVLSSVEEDIERRLGTGAESLVHPSVDSRLAAGYSAKGKNDYQLELRVQRGRGAAYKRAKKIKEKAKQEADIKIIPRVDIPSKKNLLEGARGNARLIKKKRPLHIGLSVGHRESGAGTLGCFVDTPDGEALISNCHVLALMGIVNLEEDNFINQPGKPDRSRPLGGDRVAKLLNFSEISRSGSNQLDAAIATLMQNVDHESNRIPEGLGSPFEGRTVKEVAGYEILGPGKVVCKIGRTTGFTRGVVSAIAIDGLTVWTSLGNVRFDNIVEIRWESMRRPFSKPGDSGSLVFAEDGLVAFGLHFAAGTSLEKDKETGLSFCCSLQTVLSDFDATLLD